MKKVVALLSSILLVTGMQSFAADTSMQSNIAVVNVQQVFQQSPKIAALNKKLQEQFKTRQDKLVALQKKLQDSMDKLKKEAPTMSQKDKDALQKQIANDQSTLSKEANAFQQDLAKEQGKVMKNVLAQLNDVIASIAKENHYSQVLDSQAVIYTAVNSDITKQVAQDFDKK